MVLVLTYVLELMYISELKAFIEQIPKVKLLLCECVGLEMCKSQCVGLGYSNFILSLSLSYAYTHTYWHSVLIGPDSSWMGLIINAEKSC